VPTLALVDDGVSQPKPRATGRTAKPAAPRPGAPTDPRTERPTGRRTPPRATGGRPAPLGPVVLPRPTDFTDPLLRPVVDGTPVEIPSIVPSRLADPKPDARAKVDSISGGPPTEAVPSMRTAPSVPTVPSVPVVAPGPTVLPDIFDDSLLEDPLEADGTYDMPLPGRRPRTISAPKAPVRLQQSRRPRVRRVTRVVRQVDTWSVFKIAIVFSLFLYATCLTAGVLLWQVAQNTGTVDNIERFFESFGWKTFKLKGGTIYHNAWVGGLFLVVGLTGLFVLAATLFNLITDLVGGVRVTVLEEEVVARSDRGAERASGWWRSRSSTSTEAAAPADEA
jgi:hypothetical protein